MTVLWWSQMLVDRLKNCSKFSVMESTRTNLVTTTCSLWLYSMRLITLPTIMASKRVISVDQKEMTAKWWALRRSLELVVSNQVTIRRISAHSTALISESTRLYLAPHKEPLLASKERREWSTFSKSYLRILVRKGTLNLEPDYTSQRIMSIAQNRDLPRLREKQLRFLRRSITTKKLTKMTVELMLHPCLSKVRRSLLCSTTTRGILEARCNSKKKKELISEKTWESYL